MGCVTFLLYLLSSLNGECIFAHAAPTSYRDRLHTINKGASHCHNNDWPPLFISLCVIRLAMVVAPAPILWNNLLDSLSDRSINVMEHFKFALKRHLL